jgi:ABC-2 type transport system ATP-binding protein
MSQSVIKVDRLTKRFDDTAAVDGISFAVPAGTVAGLLGGNGAGKTTTISMLLGLLLPTAGTIEVLGVDMLRHRHHVLPRMNFSSPYVDLPHRLTVAENLTVYGHLYGIARVRNRVAEVAEALDIGQFLKRPVGSLSAGQKTRVALAKALLNKPDVLLLDEPTASLDPDTADWVRTYLETYRQETNATILLASHNMLEVERLCSLVLMMRKGSIVDRGTPGDLLERYGRDTLEDVFLDIARERRTGGVADAAE